MNKTDDNATAPQELDSDQRVLRAVGRAVWRAELPARATIDQKKSSWSDGRRQYMSQAKKLVRALGKEKVLLMVQEEQDATAEVPAVS